MSKKQIGKQYNGKKMKKFEAERIEN